ncbi:unnamed protein product [Prorocentrum cordatum]|uniref:Uncharacterized protein n=1 Tax=Prorocentrum cordatum TaxID=2364126 RepID=A0ABN9RGD2_9DINO|nr:unnamed protein product [Polarella glacialis]
MPASRRRRRSAAERLRQDRSARARAAAADRPALPTLSVLERAAVKPSTEKHYHTLLSDFCLFCMTQNIAWVSHEGLGAALTAFQNTLYLDGRPGTDGSKLLAAVAHHYPSIGKQVRALLPRATRRAQAWVRRAPGHQRLPLPRAAALAAAGMLLAIGQLRMGVWVCLTFACYLRPIECFRLLGRHVVASNPQAGPQFQRWGLLLADATGGQPGKTGNWDESVLLDLDDWLIPVVAALMQATPDNAPLWPFSPSELGKQFRMACDLLGLGALEPHLYSLRRGGASDDLLRKRRSVEAVQRRGRWATSQSLKRYGKETRVLTQLNQVPSSTIEFGRVVEEHFRLIVECGLFGSGVLDLLPLRARQALSSLGTPLR